MVWRKPEICKVELSDERPNLLDEFHLSLAYEDAFREVFQYIFDMSGEDGLVVKMVELVADDYPDVEVIQEP